MIDTNKYKRSTNDLRYSFLFLIKLNARFTSVKNNDEILQKSCLLSNNIMLYHLLSYIICKVEMKYCADKYLFVTLFIVTLCERRNF